MKNSHLLTLTIYSPERKILEESRLESVIVPLADGGTIGIRPGHAPLIAETVQGPVRFQKMDVQDSLELYPGVLDIRDNAVTILTAGATAEENDPTEQYPSLSFDRLMRTLLDSLSDDDNHAAGSD